MNLKAANEEIVRLHGEGNRLRRLDEVPAKVSDVIPTGSLTLDWLVLGVGGIPTGSPVEIFGAESSGKSTLVLHILANAQKLYPKRAVLLIDAEHSFDVGYAKAVGWNPEADNSFFQQPEYMEAALDTITEMANGGDVSLVVVDSVAALVPKKELEGDSGDAPMGMQARLMSQQLRKLVGAARRNQTAVVFVNQIREKLGITFGNPETTPTGRALKFYSDVRLDVRRVETLKSGSDLPHGIKTRIKAIKNKLAAPYRQCEVEIRFGRGIDPFIDLVDVAASIGVIEKSGSWLLFGGQKIGQGRQRASEALASDLGLAGKVRAEAIGKLQAGTKS